MSYYRNPVISSDKNLRAYIIGLAIGDGNLSNPNGRAVKLRITCDTKYPDLIYRIIKSLQRLLPENKVGIAPRKRGRCLDIYVHSKHLENLLGWKAKKGSKFAQAVKTPNWIKSKAEYFIPYLKGLIETDGSVYYDRGYPMIMITTILKDLGKEIKNMMDSLGFNAHIYTIDGRKNKYNYKRQIEYHIRLSKNVQEFLDLVRPNKS